jgi:hypothetical protein
MADIPPAAVQAAAEVMFRQYESQYNADHLTWRDFEQDAREVLEAAAPHIGAAAVAAERERLVSLSWKGFKALDNETRAVLSAMMVRWAAAMTDDAAVLGDIAALLDKETGDD